MFNWTSKDGSEDKIRLTKRVNLPMEDVFDFEDPLTKIRSSFREKTSKHVSNPLTDPLSMFAQDSKIEDETDDGMRMSDHPRDDRWNGIFKPSESKSSKRILIPSSMHFVFPTLAGEKGTQLKEFSSKIEWLESHKRRSKDPVEQQKALLNAYSTCGIHLSEFPVFVGSLQSSLDQYWQEDQKVAVISLTIQERNIFFILVSIFDAHSSQSFVPYFQICSQRFNVRIFLHLQVAKLLNIPSEDHDEDDFIYSLKFFYLSDLISHFGKTVYSRLVSKSPGIRMNFSSADVCESAKEVCKNWLQKISVIRELLPRLFLEIALLKCHRLLRDGDYKDTLNRITQSIRGVANPLVNIHLRCFLIKTCQGLPVSQDLIRYIGKLNYAETKSIVGKLKYNETKKYERAVKWIIEGTLSGLLSNFDRDQIMLDHFNNLNNSEGLILEVLISAGSSALISEIVCDVLLPSIKGSTYPRGKLIFALGSALNEQGNLSLSKDEKLRVLKIVWSFSGEFQNGDSYLECAVVWVEFIQNNFGDSVKEMNSIIKDIVINIKEIKFEMKNLKNLFKIFIKSGSHALRSLHLTNFLPLFNLLGDSKAETAKLILQSIREEKNEVGKLAYSNQVVINSLLYLCQVLGDSISVLTVQDEVKQISFLISFVIRSLDDKNNDCEKRLNFYNEMRGKFGFLDRVTLQLIYSVNALSFDVYSKMEHHTNRTKSFVQACMAFAYITIPSLTDPLVKIEVYVYTAQIALLNHCLGQADACLLAGLSVLSNFSTESNNSWSESRLIACLTNLLSTALLLPDSEASYIPTMTTFSAAVEEISSFPEWTPGGLAKMYLNSLRLLSVATWKKYPYKINGLDSNDDLYGGEGFREGEALATKVLNSILEIAREAPKKDEIAFELFYIILGYSDMSPNMITLAFKLWKLTKNTDEPWILKAKKDFKCKESYEGNTGLLRKRLIELEGN